MLDVALKEWSIICDLLLEGRQALLLRKGGIHESGGPGVFEIEHPRFGLFPSWAHQKPLMIKPEFRPRVQVLDEPAQIPIRGLAQVERIWQITSRAAFDQLDDLHAWTPPQIDMRFNYKPQNPLYLMALRVSRLPSEVVIPNHAEYAGCKSWVPLRPVDEIDDAGATPVLDAAAFAAIVQRVDATLRG